MQQPLRFPAPALAVALAGALCAPVATASDMSPGRSLAATCANCHGTNGQAKGDMRPLAGMPAAELTALISAFRSGQRPATIMHQISKGYTDEQMQLIAAYFAAQKPVVK